MNQGDLKYTSGLILAPAASGKFQPTEGTRRHGPAMAKMLYMNGEKMMAVEVTTTPSFSASTPKLLFDEHFERQPGQGANYDVSPDGRRFLMVKAAPQQSYVSQINVILNWTE